MFVQNYLGNNRIKIIKKLGNSKQEIIEPGYRPSRFKVSANRKLSFHSILFLSLSRRFVNKLPEKQTLARALRMYH